MIELILGGVKSGKSKLAEQHASDSALDVIYIATAQKEFNGMIDPSMLDRIRQHELQRPAHWQLIEEPFNLADTLIKYSSANKYLLVDCLTLWLTNLLLHDDPSLLKQETDKLINSLPALNGNIIFVANETSMGIIPESKLARQFCDEAGVLHQKLASLSDRVILTVAGLPHVLKGSL
ncbi:MAG: bifunctional adenosylcobinamide kinase/adenosylcobinamide-phosphate guanylyltransferase [Gammaproteobacteria bacterium]|nr:bifunctional adenosylcobinamide kinase/adenosylcobinamide-phosphate guanylyltransferase [Gammaproteobacteria bacterium]